MPLKTWRYLSLVLAALAMSMSFAHLMEMPARLGWDAPLWVGSTVDGAQYIMFGTLGGGIFSLSVLVLVVLAIRVRHRAPVVRWLSTLAALLFTLAFLLFWIVISPVNAEIATWAGGNVPEDWSRWRLRWELGHMVNAVLLLTGFAALAWSVLEETSAKSGEG